MVMKTKLFTITSLLFLLLFSQSYAQQDKCTPVGWATQNGGTTGGGNAAATVVTTYAALKTAVASSTVKVVHIQGTITFPSNGRLTIQDQTGKSIIGLPGSKLVSVDLTAGGSGIFYVKRCKNFIFRNIKFEGPGAYDTDGNDNMTIDNCTNIWVDHCEFHDGVDGNLDIKTASDFISVTWCIFGYKKAPISGGSGGADDHRYSNLFGSSDGATGDRGKLRITMQYCWWGQGCRERMPRVRFGKVHMVNNLFTSTVSNNCIRAGFEADILAEGNYFQNQSKPIDLFENDFTAVKGINNYGASNVSSGTVFTPPYTIAVASAASILSPVQSCAGATLSSPTACSSCGGTQPNTPPTVSITAPANNASYTAPATIAITANAADANGTVSNVQFYNGSTLLGSDASSPYSFSWSNVAAGTYTITAKATDNAGAVTTSSAITVKVNNPTTNTPPTVSITAPANNASYTAPATISITANATDANGTVSNVQFYNGSTLLGSDATSPYSFSWSNVAAGTYTLTARATDNEGAVTTSSSVTISVTSPPTTTSGIISADCGSKNQTIPLQLSNDVMANATAVSWWYTGTANGISPVAGAMNKATLTTGSGFGAGDVCAGVNYNVSPWWKQYCKKINLCSAREGAAWADGQENLASEVYPNPAEEVFNLSIYEGLKNAAIMNMMGEKILELDASVLSFGKELSAGTYMLQLNYISGKQDVIKIVKLR